ncbi:tyrosine-type recombinase/integrase [Shewanella abyssi]|uniref:tyrosine-type recombinase/integrase n=1 Tax=Shewanella abyssi TaxID=311789 RepID=UPI0020106F13|nr:site-specific integrase [Shewanella abyssi]MCL1050815.1 tyrosine-type recombinase/integrase [Shewanella abyssi]
MNNKQLNKIIKDGVPGRTAIGGGLYFRLSTSGTCSWQVRYTINNKRKWFTLLDSYPHLSIADAKHDAVLLLRDIKHGKDPALEKKNALQEEIVTVHQLFDDWFKTDINKRLKHPEIPHRIYTKEIAPFIGELRLKDVTALQVRAIIHKVIESSRPATANDTLMYTKQLFRHAAKLGLVENNPALAFTMSDAGGAEKSRDRALDLDEISRMFSVLRSQSHTFTRENYLACALLITLGVRKGELIAAQWQEIDFDNKVWHLPSERSKTGIAISIPLPTAVIGWLNELKVRSAGSIYVFPSRRASVRRGYISDDTLNHALAKLFGKKVDSKKQPTKNHFEEQGVSHFVVHDLRRTCRSLLAYLGISSHIAERCLNHKIKGVEGIYNRHDYLEERREALNKLSALISPEINTN